MAIWIESPLLVSTQAVAIVAMQTLWVIGGEKREERKGDANLFYVPSLAAEAARELAQKK